MSLFSILKKFISSSNSAADTKDKYCTIIIPAHNAERTIARTLASLISNRDFIYEVIIVNDRSTDNTVKKAHEFDHMLNLRVVNNTGEHNPGAARLTGLLHAGGEWVTFVDADDCLTPSCLYYVANHLDNDIVLLHCESIFYESGSFEKNNIGQEDLSCGGNFYRREYLIKNRLFPHPTLKMAEDEYFNQKVTKFIEYLDEHGNKIGYYDYPVYEVHHDIDDGLSFALSNWADYVVKYHLLCTQYIMEDYHKYIHMRDDLISDGMVTLLFAFFSIQYLISSNEEEYDIEEQMSYFYKYIEYFTQTFRILKQDIINWYNSNSDDVALILDGAKISNGIDEIVISTPFEEFIYK